MSKRWQKVEIAYLKKHADDKSLAELAERFHTDEATVQAKLRELRPTGKAPAEGEAMDAYQQGLEALYAGEWERAATLFEGVARDGSPEVAARARQFAVTARRRAESAAPEDPWVRAVYEKNRGRLEAALALCTEDERHQTDSRFAYLAAVVCTLRGELDQGAEHLARAVELDPRNRAHALHDPDLRPLHERVERGAEPG